MNEMKHTMQPVRRMARRLSVRTLATLVLGLAVAAAALPAATSHAAGTHAGDLAAQLDTYLGSLSAQRRFSGVVLVAQQAKILLNKGYGMADLAHRVPNGPAVLYPVGGVGTTIPTWVAALRLEEQGTLHDAASVCAYLSPCPAAWKPITLGMLLAGTSGLNNYDWGGTAGQTIASRIRQCEALPLTETPGGKVNYTGCAVIVVGTILERVTGRSWAGLVGQMVLDPAGMRHSGRIVDGATPVGMAHDYSLGAAHVSPEYYNDFYQIYATVGDVYALNTAFFGGKLLSEATLQRIEMPRDAVVPPDAGITGAHWGYRWKVGTAFGHQVIYLTSAAHGFTIADLRFPRDDATLIVISNDDQNNVEDIGVHLTATLFGHTIAAPAVAARVVSPAKAVLATYRNTGSGWPFALTPGALWSPTASVDGAYNYVTRIDTKTGRVVATITVSKLPNQDQNQDSVVVANGQIWAIDHAAKAVVRIDPATNKVVATVPIGMAADQLAFGGTALWASSGDPNSVADTVVRVDVRSQKVVAVIAHVGRPYLDTAATPDAFWYISQDTLRVMRIDAATNKVVAAISAGPVPQTVFVGAGSVWVGDASGALVTRIDPRTNKVIASISTAGYPGNREDAIAYCACVYAVGDGSVWVIANNTTLLRIDPQTNRVVTSLALDDSLTTIAFFEGNLWVGGGNNLPTNTVYRINPQAMGAPPLATSGGMLLAALLGTYRRTFQNADRIAAHDSGLTDWVGGIFRIRINKGWIGFYGMGVATLGYMVEEYYVATPEGGLTMGGYLPDNQNSFCSSDPHLDPPAGTYHWARQGNLLIITRTGFDPCLDRGALLPGRWTKVG